MQEIPPLEYVCSEWQRSSQAASNLFNDGVKFWVKDDLRDIEQQLSQSETRENFTVRSIDGTKISIRNPHFGERYPIWHPRVQYQEYWRLVKVQPDGPSETYHCSYLVQWVNISARLFRGVIENPNMVFEENKLAWDESTTSKLLRLQLEKFSIMRQATRVICFGLGDMCRKPPEWMRRQTTLSGLELEARSVRDSMIQHSVALTIAGLCPDQVQLLTQDPDYTEQAQEILKGSGFSLVGRFGAGGFAEIDDNSVVFSAFVEAPLKQIIADIARPLLIISTGFEAFNDSEKPWADADSPRTMAMWEQYDRFNFIISPEDGEMVKSLHGLYLYVRKDF